jgi:hypothetical protein
MFWRENGLIYMHGLLRPNKIVWGKQNSPALLPTEYSILPSTSLSVYIYLSLLSNGTRKMAAS